MCGGGVMDYKAYNDLAWVDVVFNTVESSKMEAQSYIKLIQDKLGFKRLDLLHLGCGAGGHDYTFKHVFNVTGVDISSGMLDLAKKTNPEVDYIQGDMQAVSLYKKFDAVIIPDSIAYMTSKETLEKTIENAIGHLKESGVLIVSTQIRDSFKHNNFVYTGKNNLALVTLYENNHIVSNTTYEATLIYLIRYHNGHKEIHHETHKLGLFPLSFWETMLKGLNMRFKTLEMNDLYDEYMMDKGNYDTLVFIIEHNQE